MPNVFLTVFIILMILLASNFVLAQSSPWSHLSGPWEKMTSVYKNLYEKAYQGVYFRYLEPYLGQYIQMLKENIKQGIAEERGELSLGLQNFFSKIWHLLLSTIK